MSSRREFISRASGAMAGAGLVLAQAPPAAAQQPAASGRSKLDEVRARGKLIVGVTSEAPPFGFIDDVVKKDSPVRTIADLNKPEYTVAHLTAPVQEERGKRLYPNAKFLTFDAISSQFNAVKLGRATAAQLDAPVALYYLKDNPDIRMLDEWLTDVTGNAVFLR